MTTMECREARQLLGVYVLGAIEPAERELLDQHLAQCPACREELAGLAGLPALLSRVPRADAEMLAAAGDEDLRLDEPPPELLNSLLRQVAARRQARRWRGLAAAAAAAAVAAGGGVAAATIALSGGGPAAAVNVASATNSGTHVSAVVDYRRSGPGTAMKVQVAGIAPGTTCRFWVITRTGQREVAGQWTMVRSYGTEHWYPVRAAVPPGSVRSFQLTAARHVLLTIRAR